MTHLSVRTGLRLSPEKKGCLAEREIGCYKLSGKKGRIRPHLHLMEANRKQHRSWVWGEEEEANGEQLAVCCDLYTLAFPIFIHSLSVFNHDRRAQINYDWQELKKFGNSKRKQICAQHSREACLEIKMKMPFNLKRCISCFPLLFYFLVQCVQAVPLRKFYENVSLHHFFDTDGEQGLVFLSLGLSQDSY